MPLLNPEKRSGDSLSFELALRRKIVGQEEAVQKVSEMYQLFLAGLNPPFRPIGNLLFLGPTGTGKTRVVEATAETLFGDARACLKVDCAEFQHSHEIAKLIGSPPGYLGHRESHPILTQESLNQFHTEKLKMSLILFDEIEKASDSLWQLLLGIMDKATLTLGDNRRVDFSHCLIFLTSNLGSVQIQDMLEGGLGFHPPKVETTRFGAKMETTALDAARRKFTPEFMNRIDKAIVFRPLQPLHMEKILDIELDMVQQRFLHTLNGRQFMCQCSPAFKTLLLADGTDSKYGARHLKRSIEKNLVQPLANLVATGQIQQGDVVVADYKAGTTTFTSEPIPSKAFAVGGQVPFRNMREII